MVGRSRFRRALVALVTASVALLGIAGPAAAADPSFPLERPIRGNRRATGGRRPDRGGAGPHLRRRPRWRRVLGRQHRRASSATEPGSAASRRLRSWLRPAVRPWRASPESPPGRGSRARCWPRAASSAGAPAASASSATATTPRARCRCPSPDQHRHVDQRGDLARLRGPRVGRGRLLGPQPARPAGRRHDPRSLDARAGPPDRRRASRRRRGRAHVRDLRSREPGEVLGPQLDGRARDRDVPRVARSSRRPQPRERDGARCRRCAHLRCSLVQRLLRRLHAAVLLGQQHVRPGGSQLRGRGAFRRPRRSCPSSTFEVSPPAARTRAWCRARGPPAGARTAPARSVTARARPRR